MRYVHENGIIDEWEDIPDHESMVHPLFKGAIFYRLENIPWLTENATSGILTRSLEVGEGKDRISYKWVSNLRNSHGRPKSSDRVLVATLVQLSTEAGFGERNLLLSCKDVALRLGLTPYLIAITRIEEGLKRVAGASVYYEWDARKRGSGSGIFEIGSYHPFLGKDFSRWGHFVWNENVFAVLTSSQESE